MIYRCKSLWGTLAVGDDMWQQRYWIIQHTIGTIMKTIDGTTIKTKMIMVWVYWCGCVRIGAVWYTLDYVRNSAVHIENVKNDAVYTATMIGTMQYTMLT